MVSRRSARRTITTLEQLCLIALQDDLGLSQSDAARRLNTELEGHRRSTLDDKSIRDVFQQYCLSLANRGSLFNLVYGGKRDFDQYVAAYRVVLHNYSPKSTVRHYDDQPGVLLKALLKARGLTAQQTRHQLAERNSLFQQYSRGVLAGARYFAQFKNRKDFTTFIHKWLTDPDITAMLPHYFKSVGLPGLGPALAADFLKELGVCKLGKPDRWVKRCMNAAGWIDETATEFTIQRVFWDVSHIMGDSYPPAVIDKLMFLVGSGRYTAAEPLVCKSRFSEFERQVSSVRVT